jgi:uncharacterized protein YjbI with pentapeptide repeats
MVELDNSKLSGSDLRELELHRLIARGQNFSGAVATKGKFRNAIVHHSDFTQVNFEEANLINVEACACSFKSANFNGARLIGAQFNWSRFGGATFNQSDIGGACFENCCLCDADFSGALRIGEANFANAIFNETTIWPNGFVPANAELLTDMDGQPWGA